MAQASCRSPTRPSTPATRCCSCSTRASRTRWRRSSSRLRAARPRSPGMADRAVDHLLIGGGLASANCARWLREEGGDGSILLVGRENDPPYNRPPLSKGYLGGKESREEVLFRPDEWWKEQRIDLLTRTSVMKLDAGARRAKLSNGDEVAFETARLAT